IALSVMSSMYLESVIAVNDFIRARFGVPVIWGGVYPTLFPEKCLGYADYVIRGEGEEAFCELTGALNTGGDISSVRNLAYRTGGAVTINPVRPLVQNLDTLGYPKPGEEGISFLDKDKIIGRDPLLSGVTYETAASRGCPFACSYCSSVNLKRIYRGKDEFVRFRSVDSVIAELSTAKEAVKKLSLIRFWDEIFSDAEGWVEEFAERYKKEINIPFNIWGHPLKISRRIISSLVDAGLHQIVVGVQSGSDRIRKDIFHRSETREQIIEASRILSSCGVPSVVYDFMIRHPFESDDDLRATFELCMELEPPFELQLHGLNFLPGTDIVGIALKNNLITAAEMEHLMYGPMQEQYDMYWGRGNVLTALIYMTQFEKLRPLLEIYESRVAAGGSEGLIIPMHKMLQTFNRIKHTVNNFRLLRRRN
ncbi:MAG: radical SAM protein, partial [Eubacteriales bacterium]|nr:radical SAM protein [Eubacteriales bacterium]